MTTNQTIDGVPRLRGLLDKLDSLDVDEFQGWAFEVGDELRALLDAHVEPIPDDYVPLDGMFRLEETEQGMTYWLKAGGYKSRLYDFMASHPYLDFYGLKWEWNGDLKVAFRWNCAPELRISERVPIEENQETILGGVLPLVMVVRESNMPPGRIQAVSKPAAQPQGKPVACAHGIRAPHACDQCEAQNLVPDYWEDPDTGTCIDQWSKVQGLNGTEAYTVPLYRHAEQPAPVSVVLPERMPGDDGVCTESHYALGWSACLDEVTRLNTK